MLQIIYRNRLRRVSLKLAIEYDILPSLLILRGVECHDQRTRHGTGAFADVFVGTYQGRKVALKCLRALLTIPAEERTSKKKVY